jgi:hypothetical protein
MSEVSGTLSSSRFRQQSNLPAAPASNEWTGDIEQWKKVEKLWRAGCRFFSYSSFPGAEPLPERLREVADFVARNPDYPFRVADPD